MMEKERKNGCATCRDRKIACDASRPTCKNCMRSGRSCKYHKLRLSWPKANDRRRALSAAHPNTTYKCSNWRFINTSSRDVNVHLRRIDPRTVIYGHAAIAPLSSFLRVPSSTCMHRQSRLRDESINLVPYFFSAVLSALPAFGIDITHLRGLITRLAFSDDSTSTQAVLHSLLALATFYRTGDKQQTTQLTVAALKSLRLSAQSGLSREMSLQHIVASMLICSVEMHSFALDSSTWYLHLSNAKEIISRFYEQSSFDDKDQKLLFQWVFYYDTMARLGVSHWRGKTTFQKHLQKEVGFDRLVLDEITNFSSYGHDVLTLLYEFCARRAPMGHIHAHSEKYLSWLNGMENKLLDVRANLKHEEAETCTTTATQSESILVKELFILAVLLYIDLTSNGHTPTTKKTEWINDAFDIFSRIEYCNKPFAYVIFGCEARTDWDRSIVLDVLDRTIASKGNGLLLPLRDVLFKTWVHDDLSAAVTLTEMSAEALCNKSCLILSTAHSVACLV